MGAKQTKDKKGEATFNNTGNNNTKMPSQSPISSSRNTPSKKKNSTTGTDGYLTPFSGREGLEESDISDNNKHFLNESPNGKKTRSATVDGGETSVVGEHHQQGELNSRGGSFSFKRSSSKRSSWRSGSNAFTKFGQSFR